MKMFPFGTVLKIQREYSHRDIFERLKKIKDLGMNEVVIWPAIYWWEDKNQADYPYATGKKILQMAEELELEIIMELTGQLTSLEYAPDFKMKDDYYSQSIDGHFNNKEYYFGTLNFNHPEVQMLIKDYLQTTVQIYKDFKALKGFDVWNETMFASYDSYTLAVFQKWLENKYGTIEKINDAWDRAYENFGQICFTEWTWASIMPVVDYYEFRKDNISMILYQWNQWIKRVDIEHPVIADNIHSMITEDWSFDRPHDDWGNARQVDDYGISFYPKVSGGGKKPWERSQVFEGIHAASKDGQFYISEMQSHNQALFTPMSVVYPYEIKFWNYEAISRGCKGIIYWMWEPFIKGLQLSGRGLVDFSGDYTERAFSAKKVMDRIHSNNEIFSTYQPIKPKIGILYDKDNHNFIKALSRNYQNLISFSHYTEALSGIYHFLWELNKSVTFVTPEELGGVKCEEMTMLFVTSQLLMTEAYTSKFLDFLNGGGNIVSDGRFGMLDQRGIMHKNLPGGPFHEHLGLKLVDIDCNGLGITATNDSEEMALLGHFERQTLKILYSDSTVLGTFEGGSPAIISKPIGKGQFVYMGSYIWLGYHMGNRENQYFLEKLVDTYGKEAYEIHNPNIKISLLQGDDGWVVFGFNYSLTDQVGEIALDYQGSQVTLIDRGETVKTRFENDKLLFNLAIPAQQAYMYHIKKRWRDEKDRE